MSDFVYQPRYTRFFLLILAIIGIVYIVHKFSNNIEKKIENKASNNNIVDKNMIEKNSHPGGRPWELFKKRSITLNNKTQNKINQNQV